MIRATALFLLLALATAACGSSPSSSAAIEVVAEGLLAPIGLAQGPDGSILIAEDGTGEDDDSAGISLLSSDGTLRRVIEGFPSGRDSGDLSGSAMVGVSPDGSTVFVGNFGAGHLWSVPFERLRTAAEPLGLSDLDVTMSPLNNVRLTNPFDVTFSPRDVPVVSDASENGVATLNPDGTTNFVHRFGELEDPNEPAQRIDAVPTGIARLGDEYLVTLTGGCPYPPGSGQLVAIGADRSQRTVVDGLDMPIDVEVGPSGTVWLLEFAEFDQDASCFTGSGYQAGTGTLSRVGADGTLETAVEGLNNPGAVLQAADGSIYVSEVFNGRVVKITIEGEEIETPAVSAPAGGLTDVAVGRGVDFVHGSFTAAVSADPVAAMGGGVCWIDVDNDGWLDLYMVNSYSLDEESLWEQRGGLPTAALYRNDEGTFSRVGSDSGTALAIRGNGCVAADLNGDGLTDLYVTADGPNHLLLNQGDFEFREAAEAAGVDAPEWNTAAVVGDVNGDGVLDLFVAAYIDLAVTVPKPVGAFPQDFSGLADRLYLGLGTDADGTPQFEDAALEMGLDRQDRGLGAAFTDVDADGDLDLYIANDGNPNRLYLNDGEALRDVTDEADVGDSGSGMGVATGDYDLDGLPDLFVTNWDRELHALYRSEESGDIPRYAYSTFRIGIAGLGNGQTGWGTAWVDIDHDRDEDLIAVHGRVPVADLDDDAELVRVYLNQASDGALGQFRDATVELGLEAVGRHSARGSAAADFDNDGDLDLAVNVIGGHALLLENDAADGTWLVVQPEPATPGTVVEVSVDDVTMRRELAAGSSYLSSEDPRLHFGLDHVVQADIEVIWPGGKSVALDAVDAGQILVVSPGD